MTTRLPDTTTPEALADTSQIEMNHLRITPEVAVALGKTVDELAKMTLGEFCEWCFYKGFDVRQTGWETSSEEGKLTIRMDSENRPIVRVTTP